MPTHLLLLDELRRDVPEFPDAIRTSDHGFGQDEFFAYVQAYYDNDTLVVRLELPDDHPAFEEVDDPNQAEFVVIVPRDTAKSASLTSVPDETVPDPRPALRAAMARRAAAADRERIARIAEEMRSGRRARPKLDGLTDAGRRAW
jgi:hypothetical protein